MKKVGRLLVGAALSAGTSMILVGCGAQAVHAAAPSQPLADARGSVSAAAVAPPAVVPAASVGEAFAIPAPPVPTVRQVMRMCGNTKMPSYQDGAYCEKASQ